MPNAPHEAAVKRTSAWASRYCNAVLQMDPSPTAETVQHVVADIYKNATPLELILLCGLLANTKKVSKQVRQIFYNRLVGEFSRLEPRSPDFWPSRN